MQFFIALPCFLMLLFGVKELRDSLSNFSGTIWTKRLLRSKKATLAIDTDIMFLSIEKQSKVFCIFIEPDKMSFTLESSKFYKDGTVDERYRIDFINKISDMYLHGNFLDLRE